MAGFSGTIKEFTKFIGGYARIKVMHLAAMSCLEFCGEQKHLEAAHVKGLERPVLVSRILSEFLEDDLVKTDLNLFEERFVAAHQPIESTIKILCKTCHKDYDRKEKKPHEPSDSGSTNEESAIIENLINNQMNKSKALEYCRRQGFAGFTSANTIFSNIILSLKDGGCNLITTGSETSCTWSFMTTAKNAFIFLQFYKAVYQIPRNTSNKEMTCTGQTGLMYTFQRMVSASKKKRSLTLQNFEWAQYPKIRRLSKLLSI
ncbi:MAG: hypothetical protein H0U44_09830 [Flavisolibacter sp.]|nr:hypothetical protein [Flavisolibacter sp.]